VEFLVGKGPQVAETSVCNHHVDLVLEIGGRNATEGPAINSDFAPDPNLISEEAEDLMGILIHCHGIWRSLGSAIASIIPNQTIYLLAQEILQVERVRVIDHVLVAHGVRVAQDEGVIVQIGCVLLGVVLRIQKKRLLIRSEEHAIDLDA
jgi:hypothetical protein